MRLVRSPVATWRRLPQGVVLALPGDTSPQKLNHTGAIVWDLLVKPVAPEAIATSLATACRVPLAEVTASLAPLLSDLLGRAAIVEVAG